MKVKFTIIYFALILFLVGCSNEDQPKDVAQKTVEDQAEKHDETENEPIDVHDKKEKKNDQKDKATLQVPSIEFNNLPNVPINASDIIHQTSGEFAMFSWDDQQKSELLKAINKLQPLPKDATDEQLDDYYRYLYSLVAEDFPDPQDTI
uniref:hypothetical protein n=1 Tax=Lentibacillus saliphilus TaxID=2737028 RepID=UPI003CCEC13B